MADDLKARFEQASVELVSARWAMRQGRSPEPFFEAADAAARRALTFNPQNAAAYQTAAGRIWIITEADRSVTTVLLPEEY